MPVQKSRAFQSAAWQVDAATPALQNEVALAHALDGYRRRRRQEIGGHQRFLAMTAASTRTSAIQKLMFSAAVRDRQTARLLHAFASRSIPVRRFLAPRALARAGWINLRARIADASSAGPAATLARS